MLNDSMPTWNSSLKGRKQFESSGKGREKKWELVRTKDLLVEESLPIEDLVRDNGITTQSNGF